MSEPVLEPVSHEQFVADIGTLRERLADEGWRPDFLVGVGRGGLVPGAYLSHALGVTLLSIDHSSREPGFAAELTARLAEKTIAGRRLLIIDDINDSGSTIIDLRRALAAGGAVEGHVRVAVLMSNIRSSATVDYWARQIDRAVDKRWFVFPWEAMAPQRTLAQDALAMPDRLG